jgi:hypothetical protein
LQLGESTETPSDDIIIAQSGAATTLVGEIISDSGFFRLPNDCLRLTAKDFVPVAALDGRPKPRERDAEFSRK